ncbi:amidase [Roseovarius sp. Pro17]|uniref:amidase n=1 Tax=Roseovarius sp. Pro17 TaxID=3108175 RepID=UPI002D793563|nr:amidase [Roseovarius sp. Pro17]
MKPLAELERQLKTGEVSSAELTSTCLDRILDAKGEGSRTFTMIDPDLSCGTAHNADTLRKRGDISSPLAGIPVSIKALFDIGGKVTTAGSTVLATAATARADAAAVARLRAAGMVVMGHTNMTEFAYSGLGLNPHYGTPGNPADRSRIPGGSSSGAAVSVADGMAAAALGTDTGGSCRIPAAFCGLVGFKPTARRVPLTGAFPLSQSYDSIGPIARTVDCCARLDAVLADDPTPEPEMPPLADLRIAVLDNYVTESMEEPVARAYQTALDVLAKAGAVLTSLRLDGLDDLPALNARGGIIAAEALQVHQELLKTHGDAYDPRVAVRILKAESQYAGELEDLLAKRTQMIAVADAATRDFDAVLMPTTPMEAPRFDALNADEDLYGSTNLLALRNPTVANFLDRCAITLPLPIGSGLPVGLMLMGRTMGDRHLLAIARRVEMSLG